MSSSICSQIARGTAVLALGAIAATPWALAADAPAAAAAANRAATDRASYFNANDIQNIWKDLEKRQVINQRVMEGGDYSINIRIVKPDDLPLVHSMASDVWVVMSGTATAVTGGELLDKKQRPNPDDVQGTSIRGGVNQPLKAGDILYVPPGVPHGFKDVKDFRGFLIRFEPKKAAPAAK